MSKKRFYWGKRAEKMIENAGWVNYSNNIAIRILSAIEDSGITQEALAEKIGVSKRYMNNIVKGKQNLSLKMIYDISNVLGVELIAFPDYKYNS